ncbi:MAG: hypothetical protein F4W92_09495 [Gammaproteobacteria bacterium]|nr:hypothetical protein [Gammaproteobacteria bacterium]
MPPRKHTQLAKFSFSFVICLASLGTLYHGENESDQEPQPVSDTNGDAYIVLDEQEIRYRVAFTLMDKQAMSVYRALVRTHN